MGKNEKKEEKAWKEYLASIESRKEAKQKKGVSISERIRKLLESLGIGRKAKEIEEVKKQIAISVAEGRKIAKEKPAAIKPTLPEKKPVARKPSPKKSFGESLRQLEEGLSRIKRERMLVKEKKPLDLEKYLARVEQKRKAEAEMKALGKPLRKPGAAVAARPKKPKKKRGKPGAKRKRAVPKKVSLLPKAKAKKKPVIIKKVAFLPKRKKAKKPARKARKRKVAKKKAVKVARRPKVEARVIAEALGEKLSLAKKPIKEIKRLSAAEIKMEVKREKIATKARGWYGEVLRHKMAALSGWRVRKKVKLHQLKRKEKKNKLTERERKQKKTLLGEDRLLRTRIRGVETKIRALQKITKQKKKEGKLLKKKAKAAGVKIPKVKVSAIARGRKKFKKRSEMMELVDAMKSVADEMASAAAKRSAAGFDWKESLTIEDQIKTQKSMVKNLEVAFYKRKVDFDQFREKMFEHQSKLSELKIQKKLAEDRMAKMPPAMREEIKRRIMEAKQARPPKIELEKKTAEALKKLTEKEKKRETEKAEDKKFAQRTAEALQKIAERLGGRPKGVTQPAAEKVAPRPAPAEKVAPRPTFEQPKRRLEKIVERRRPPRRKEAKRPVERVIERIREEVPWRHVEKPEKPKVSRVVDKAIKQKAEGSDLSKHQVDKIEEKLGQLLEKYNIPDNALASHIRTLDSSRLVQDFQKLIRVIETKKESATAELIRPAPGFDIETGIIARKREKIVGKEKEIRRAKIETSFDRVLGLVQVKGIVSLNEVAKQLKMNKREIQECADVLERARLIKLVYPPIGSVKLVYPPYLEWKAQQKKKKREQKKKKKK